MARISRILEALTIRASTRLQIRPITAGTDSVAPGPSLTGREFPMLAILGPRERQRVAVRRAGALPCPGAAARAASG
jgi:hypothetical protein